MRNSPLISVITITLNDLIGLKYTVDSVERQTYDNYEHIVVDGMSSDGTVEFCSVAEKRHPKLSYTSEKDDGIFDAMNKGARIARGDLLVFVNSSDRLTDPSVLDFVAGRWTDDEDWQWGYGAMRYTKSPGSTPYRGTVQAPFNRRKFQLGRQFIPHTACYVGREFFLERGGYDESFGVAAEQEFFMRACQNHPPAVWIRFLGDFMEGGAHSKVSVRHMEMLWHRMRVKNGVAIANSRHVDRAISLALAAGERSILGVRKILKGAPDFPHIHAQAKYV